MRLVELMFKDGTGPWYVNPDHVADVWEDSGGVRVRTSNMAAPEWGGFRVRGALDQVLLALAGSNLRRWRGEE